ncbi:tetratricopeptide repeat protein [Rhizomicrobium palustre]|uniref:tetratricopeptide repeat protein n=1 Tax=Rhizomicrobium palustre TaxID=189966 RepID=UPI0014227F35
MRKRLSENTGEGENYEALQREKAAALNAIASQAIVASPRARDGVEASLSRIEARLAASEKTCAALEEKLGEKLKGLDIETAGLADRLHALRQRLDKFEDKQLAALSEIRFDLLKLGAQPQSAPVYTQGEIEEAPEEPPREKIASPSYLEKARSAAKAAQIALEEIVRPVKRSHKRFWWRYRWLVLMGLAVVVVWFDAYVFAHYQPAQGAIVAEASPVAGSQHQIAFGSRAQLVRGLRYINGTGVPIDLAKGRAYIELAARSGDPVAENMMGVLAQTGTGGNSDIAAAAGWFERAAGHGNLKAMANLGKLYAGGWREGTDYSKAAIWFERAATLGDIDAAFDLAVLSERGLGVAMDLASAYKWYAIAGVRGDAHAAARAQVLAESLPARTRAALDRAVAAFQPRKIDPAANTAPALQG